MACVGSVMWGRWFLAWLVVTEAVHLAFKLLQQPVMPVDCFGQLEDGLVEALEVLCEEGVSQLQFHDSLFKR